MNWQPICLRCFEIDTNIHINKSWNSMKRKTHLLCLQIAALLAVLSFGLHAYAEGPREELKHAYHLLKTADHDYAGHRVVAMHAIEEAGHELGMDLGGEVSDHERQWKSDARVREAGRLLRHARDNMENHDRTRVAEKIETAIKEVDEALKVK